MTKPISTFRYQLAPVALASMTAIFLLLSSASTSAIASNGPTPQLGVRIADGTSTRKYVYDARFGNRSMTRFHHDYGRQARHQLSESFKLAMLTGANGRESSSQFDLVAYIHLVGAKVFHATPDQFDVEVCFEVTFKNPQGQILTTKRIVGSSSQPIRRHHETPSSVQTLLSQGMRLSILQTSRNLVSLFKDQNQLQQILLNHHRNRFASDPDALSREGARLFAAREYRQAFWYFEDAVSLSTRHQAALAYKGASLMKLGYHTAGQQNLRQAETVDSSTAEAAQARKWLAVSL